MFENINHKNPSKPERIQLLNERGKPIPPRPSISNINTRQISKNVLSKKIPPNKVIDIAHWFSEIFSVFLSAKQHTRNHIILKEFYSLPNADLILSLFIECLESIEKFFLKLTDSWVAEYHPQPPLKKGSIVVAQDNFSTKFICEISDFIPSSAKYLLKIHRLNTKPPASELNCVYEDVLPLRYFLDSDID